MIRAALFIMISLGTFLRGSSFYTIHKDIPPNSYTHLLKSFKKNDLPYEAGKSKPVRLSMDDSAFVKGAAQSKYLISVTDPNAAVWDDADDEGKIHFDFTDLIGAGGMIPINNDITLLEIADMYELKGESESNKQGIFTRTNFLCTFNKSGKLINAVVAGFILSNEFGSINRWSCTVNPFKEIVIKEYGNRKDQKDAYSFTTTLKIMDDGRIVKTKSTKG